MKSMHEDNFSRFKDLLLSASLVFTCFAIILF